MKHCFLIFILLFTIKSLCLAQVNINGYIKDCNGDLLKGDVTYINITFHLDEDKNIKHKASLNSSNGTYSCEVNYSPPLLITIEAKHKKNGKYYYPTRSKQRVGSGNNSFQFDVIFECDEEQEDLIGDVEIRYQKKFESLKARLDKQKTELSQASKTEKRLLDSIALITTEMNRDRSEFERKIGKLKRQGEYTMKIREHQERIIRTENSFNNKLSEKDQRIKELEGELVIATMKAECICLGISEDKKSMDLAIRLRKNDGSPINDIVSVDLELVRIKEEGKGRDPVHHYTGEAFKLALNANKKWHKFTFDATEKSFYNNSAYEIFIKNKYGTTVNDNGLYIARLKNNCKERPDLNIDSPTRPSTYLLQNRIIKTKKTIPVGGLKMKLRIKDNRNNDGDVVSLFLNNEIIVSELKLSNQTKEYTIELLPGSNSITLLALDEGSRPTCTVLLSIEDEYGGLHEERLKSDYNTCEEIILTTAI